MKAICHATVGECGERLARLVEECEPGAGVGTKVGVPATSTDNARCIFFSNYNGNRPRDANCGTVSSRHEKVR